MKKSMKANKSSGFVIFFLLIFVSLLGLSSNIISKPPKVYAATAAVNLLTTENFAVFAKTAITDIPTSAITGDVGLSSGAGITGLTCAEVTGTVYDGDGGFVAACRVTDAAKLTTAETDLVTAANDASGRTPTTTFVTTDNQLGGQTLTAGVYAFGHGTTNNLTGTLILDGQGDPNAVWIFQASSDLVTASSSVVSLINSAQACNVFWVVSTQATLGSSSTFVGTIMASTSVVMNTSATLNGRAMSRTAAVTLDHNTISKPTCLATTSSSSSTVTVPALENTAPNPPCPTIEIGVVAPTIIDSRRVDSDSIYLSWGPYSGTNDFIVRYGTSKDNLIYNVDVTGFSTTLNALPANTPIWVQVAARNECQIGTFELPILIGQIIPRSTLSPRLPNTGNGSSNTSTFAVLAVVPLGLLSFFLTRRVYKLAKKR